MVSELLHGPGAGTELRGISYQQKAGEREDITCPHRGLRVDHQEAPDNMTLDTCGELDSLCVKDRFSLI